MRAVTVLVFTCAAALAQAPQKGAIMRGVLLELDPEPGANQFSVRASNNQVFRYRFDSTTYVERDSKPAAFSALKPGDRLEVVSDQDGDGPARYALIVKVLADPAPVERPIQGRSVSVSPGPPRSSFGAATFYGVVFGISDGRIAVRLKDGRQRNVLLRGDTRYLEDSKVVSAAELRANMRVTVTGSYNPLGSFEADQIVWGRILQP